MEGGGGAKAHRQKWWEARRAVCPMEGGHNCVKVCVWDDKWDLEEEEVGTVEMSQKVIRYLSKSIQ